MEGVGSAFGKKTLIEGTKHDVGKPDITLVSPEILAEIYTYRKIFVQMGSKPHAFGKDPADLLNILKELVRNRSYVMAAAMVFVIPDFKVSIDDVVKVYTEGANKYGRHNWKKVRPIDRYLAAAHRHLKLGINDDDFGLPHLAHFCWNMFALRWFELRGVRHESDVEDLKVMTMENQ
jgi:hypothetical protein